MIKSLILACILTLTGCSYFQVHKMDIEQGNLISKEKLSKIHTGMGKDNVIALLGTPILANVFDNNHIAYIYTMKAGNSDLKIKYITLTFSKDKLTQIQGNMLTP